MNKERGNIILYGVIALFVITLAGGVVYTYTDAISRAEKAEASRAEWEKSAKENAAELQKVKDEKAKTDKVLAARQAQRNAADEIGRKVDNALSKARSNPEVQKWSDTTVPQLVVDGLRNAEHAPADPEGGAVLPGAKPAAKTSGRAVAR